MNTNCKELSKKAREIFEKIKDHFPPDPWKNPQWREEGIVISNGTFDLRRSADRKALMDREQSQIGYIVVTIDAASARDKTDGTVTVELSRRTYNPMIMRHVNLYLLLNDLDFQIETTDVIDECNQTEEPEVAQPTETTQNCPNCGCDNYDGIGPCTQCGHGIKVG